MPVNRLRNPVRQKDLSIPAPAFGPCPAVLLQGVSGSFQEWQRHIYQRAFEEAQAVVRPSWIESDPLGVWN
jgi:hypothetical protein